MNEPLTLIYGTPHRGGFYNRQCSYTKKIPKSINFLEPVISKYKLNDCVVFLITMSMKKISVTSNYVPVKTKKVPPCYKETCK